MDITKNVVSAEDQYIAYRFLRCFMDWVTLRFLSIVDDDEYRWILFGRLLAPGADGDHSNVNTQRNAISHMSRAEGPIRCCTYLHR